MESGHSQASAHADNLSQDNIAMSMTKPTKTFTKDDGDVDDLDPFTA